MAVLVRVRSLDLSVDRVTGRRWLEAGIMLAAILLYWLATAAEWHRYSSFP